MLFLGCLILIYSTKKYQRFSNKSDDFERFEYCVNK